MIPKTMNYKCLSDVLSYTCIANNSILRLQENKERLTAVFELHISVVESEEYMQNRHDRFMRLISDFPEDSIVSIYYCKNVLNTKLPVLNSHKNEIINYIEKKQIDLLKSRKNLSYQCFMSVSIPLKVKKAKKGGIDLIDKFSKNDDKHDEIEMNKEFIEKAIDRMKLIEKGFCGAIGGGAFRLDSSQITQFLSLLLNHNYLESYSELSGIVKSDVISSFNGITKSQNAGYVYYGGNYHSILSLRAYGEESHLPEYTSAKMNDIFLHQDLNEIPFLIHHVIKLPNKTKAMNTAKNRKNMIAFQSGLSNISFFAKTPEGVPPKELKIMIEDAISNVNSNGFRFVTQQFQIHLWAESLKKLDDMVNSFQATINDIYTLKREKYNIRASYFSLFPGNEDINPINTMLPSYSVSDYLPIDMPRYCYPADDSKNFIYFYTKEDQLTKIDLFDKRADNWNSIVCGGSGSGKSFIMNDILFQYAVYNPQIAIVDYGGVDSGSYRNFIINNNGTYLEINLDSYDFSVNPFDGQMFNNDEKLNAWKFASLMATIERMAIDNEHPITANTRYFLKEELLKYYKDKKNNLDNRCNITEFAEKYLKDNKNFECNQDLHKRLYAFIGGEDGIPEGPFSRFFRKTNTIKNKDFLCFDLAGLKGMQQLKSVLIPVLLDMIFSNVLVSSEKERKKLVIMDEAWADLKGGSMTDFMEEMFRTIRKLGGNISIITQRFLDVLSSDIGGAVLANTSYFYFIGNKHTREPLLKATASSSKGTLSLSDFDIEKIINSQSKRDFYLLTPFFSGLLKFYPTKEFCMLATTDADEKNKLRKHMEQLGVGIVTPEVIESAYNEF